MRFYVQANVWNEGTVINRAPLIYHQFRSGQENHVQKLNMHAGNITNQLCRKSKITIHCTT